MNTEYRKYLQSSDWKAKRREKYSRRGGTKRRCAICAATERLDVHHLRYESDLTQTKQEDLRILCRDCHECAHALMRSGALKFKSENHHSRYALTKTAVKKARGMHGITGAFRRIIEQDSQW